MKDTTQPLQPQPAQPEKPRNAVGQYLPVNSQSKSARSRRKSRARNRQALLKSVGATADKAPVKGIASYDVGLPGGLGGDALRVRRALNLATMQGMLEAYRRGGRKAIDRVMREAPAIFLKMLVLLVPRELEVMHSQGVKAMTDQQIEDAIAAISAMIDRRAEAAAMAAKDVTPATTSSMEASDQGTDQAKSLK